MVWFSRASVLVTEQAWHLMRREARYAEQNMPVGSWTQAHHFRISFPESFTSATTVDGVTMDDAWEDEQEISNSLVMDREWKIRYERLFQQGYRSGIDSGMEEQMQDGFNDGFHVGFFMGKRLGFVEGALKVAAKVSPKDAEAVDDARTALKATGRSEATESCLKRLASFSEPAPPLAPPISSKNALAHAEALCLQLGYSKFVRFTLIGPPAGSHSMLGVFKVQRIMQTLKATTRIHQDVCAARATEDLPSWSLNIQVKSDQIMSLRSASSCLGVGVVGSTA